MRDNNVHFKITSVQCTYYKPGHLRPVLMLKPHYSSKCNCGCHFFIHLLAVAEDGTEFVGLRCANCGKFDICFKDEADAALKTGCGLILKVSKMKISYGICTIVSMRNNHFLNLINRMLVHAVT